MITGQGADVLTSFPVVRYRITARITRAARLGAYAGSTFRGIFGHALKAIACELPERDTCKECPLRQACTYSRLFEPAPAPQALFANEPPPVPYIIEPPTGGDYAPGQTLVFHVILLGEAIPLLPWVLSAFRRGLQNGFGDRHLGSADIEHVADCLPEPHNEGAVAKNLSLPTTTMPFDATLAFVTPVRLQQQGRPIAPEQATPAVVLPSLVWRVLQLQSCHTGFPASRETGKQWLEGIEGLPWAGSLSPQSLGRRSQRQQAFMEFDVLSGSWQVYGLPPHWLPLLYLGQWVHVGRGASFGLGQYVLNTSHATP